MSTCLYNLNDIYRIKRLGFSYMLPNEVIDNIRSFESSITPIDNKKKEKSKPKHSMEDWEAIRSFKPTKKVEVKEGIDTYIYNLRNALNKISEKNLEKQKETIFKNMDDIMCNEELNNKKDEVVNMVYDLVSVNKVYSRMYAELYKDLVEKYDIFKYKLNKIVNEYKSSLLNVEFVSAEENYDEYCKYNKANDKVKSRTLFISNLLKIGMVSSNDYFDIMQYLIMLLLKNADIENKENEVDELTENMFIIVDYLDKNYKNIKLCEEYLLIKSKMEEILGKENTSYKSMTKRCKFRLMDIIEIAN